MEQSQPAKPGDRFLALSREEQMMLRRAHQNLCHPSPSKLSAVLRSQGARSDLTQAVFDMPCDVCASKQLPKIARPCTVKLELDFNDKVFIDGVTCTNSQGKKLSFLPLDRSGYQLSHCRSRSEPISWECCAKCPRCMVPTGWTSKHAGHRFCYRISQWTLFQFPSTFWCEEYHGCSKCTLAKWQVRKTWPCPPRNALESRHGTAHKHLSWDANGFGPMHSSQKYAQHQTWLFTGSLGFWKKLSNPRFSHEQWKWHVSSERWQGWCSWNCLPEKFSPERESSSSFSPSR